MWLQVATCILGSNEFRWASGQGMLPKAQLPAVSLSRVQLHTQASFSNLLSFRLLWKKMTSVVTYLTLCHQKLQWKSNQESNSTCEKQKPSLKKKKKLIQQKSLCISSTGLCAHMGPSFPSQETGLDSSTQSWNSGGINSSKSEAADFRRKPGGICIKEIK